MQYFSLVVYGNIGHSAPYLHGVAFYIQTNPPIAQAVVLN